MDQVDEIEATPDEITLRRTRRLVRGIGTSLLTRGLAVLSSLLLVPLALNYMGAEDYAVWMAAASLTAMAAFADLGLGQGIMTAVTPMLAAQRQRDARRIISTAYALLVLVAATGIGVVILMGQVTQWYRILGVGEESPTSAIIASICLIGFLINVPLSLVIRVQFAMQKVSAANLWQASGSCWSVGLAGLAVLLNLGSVLVVVSVLLGPLIANLTASVWVYTRNPQIAPALGDISRDSVRPLTSLGFGYLTLNIVIAIATNVDLLLVSHHDSVAGVVAFAVATRLFAQLGAVISLINVPLWPANADALARGDEAWVRRTTRRMTWASSGMVLVLAAPLILIGDQIIEIWTRQPINTPQTMLFGLSMWWLILALLSPRFMVQNSVGIVHPQLVGWICYLVASIPAKVWILSVAGFQWIPLVGGSLLIVTVVPGCIVGYRRAYATSTGNRT